MIRVRTDEEKAEAQRELRAHLRVTRGPVDDAEPTSLIPPVKNVGMATALGDTRVLRFRVWQFVVPPVSYRDGVALDALQIRLARLGDTPHDDLARLREVEEALEEAVGLFRRLVRPASWLGRACWWLIPNPFADATEGEIGHLFAYFTACRMRSGVRPADSTPARRSARSTRRMT